MRRIFLFTPMICLLLFALNACGAVQASHPRVNQWHNHVIAPALLFGSSAGEWPMFGYNPAHTSYVDQAVQAHNVLPQLLWSQQFKPIFSSAVAGAGLLYIASSDGYLYALKEATGTVIWRARLGDHLTDATPALQGQILFVAANSTQMEAFNALTGQPYWYFETNEKIQAAPLVIGNKLLVASRTTLWCLDTSNGRLLWKFHRGAVGWPTTASPTVMGTLVYIGFGSMTQLWAVNLDTGQLVWSFDTGDRITSTAVVGNERVYVATWHGLIIALNRMTGVYLWSYALNSKQQTQSVIDGVGGNLAFAQGRLYVGSYRGILLCLDALHGKPLWRFATGAQILATPLISTALVYVGSGDGNFYALNVRTGRPAWHYATGEIRSSAILAYGHLYIGSVNGSIYAFGQLA